jgi:hypothetical protein
VTHLLELAVSLAVKEAAVSVEDRERGDALLERDAVLVGEVGVVVVVADVDVNENEALVEELCVGLLTEVNVEDLAIAAPVAAEVEDDALVFTNSGGQSVTNISVGVSVFVVDMAGLELLGEGREDAEGGEESEEGWGGFACHVGPDGNWGPVGIRMPQAGRRVQGTHTISTHRLHVSSDATGT